jgi:hypothetical protein
MSMNLGVIPFVGVGYFQNLNSGQFGVELGARFRATWTGPANLRAGLAIEHIFLNPGTFADLVQLDLTILSGRRWALGPSVTAFNYDKAVVGANGSIRF